MYTYSLYLLRVLVHRIILLNLSEQNWELKLGTSCFPTKGPIFIKWSSINVNNIYHLWKTQITIYNCKQDFDLRAPPPPRGIFAPLILNIMHWSPQIPKRKFLSSLKVFSFAPQILEINSASPQIPKNISQFSLKCIFLSIGLNSHT